MSNFIALIENKVIFTVTPYNCSVSCPVITTNEAIHYKDPRIKMTAPIPLSGSRTHTSKGYAIAMAAIGLVMLIYMLGEFAVPLNSSSGLKLQVYTHNIRYDNKKPVPGEKLWSERKSDVVNSMRFHSKDRPTIITMQEALKNQLDDVLELLGSNWEYYGVAREDGVEDGEFGPIFYDKTQFKVLDKQTLWLSETPGRPSRGWDAQLRRIVTCVHFEGANGARFNVYNTHLDHAGVVARAESMKLIARINWNEDPVVLTGDFNSEPSEGAYQTIAKYYNDTRVHNDMSYGYEETFTGFNTEGAKVIDYIFASHLQAEYYAVLPNEFAFKMSDHRPVVAGFAV